MVFKNNWWRLKFGKIVVISVLEMIGLYYVRNNISNYIFPGIHLVHKNDFIYKSHEALKML